MMLQLNPPLPVETPRGKAVAHMVIDYGPESDLLWICFDDETGECWSWPNPKIRIQNNISYGRTVAEKQFSKETSASAQGGIGRLGYSVGQNWTTTRTSPGSITMDIVTNSPTGYFFTQNGMTTN